MARIRSSPSSSWSGIWMKPREQQTFIVPRSRRFKLLQPLGASLSKPCDRSDVGLFPTEWVISAHSLRNCRVAKLWGESKSSIFASTPLSVRASLEFPIGISTVLKEIIWFSGRTMATGPWEILPIYYYFFFFYQRLQQFTTHTVKGLHYMMLQFRRKHQSILSHSSLKQWHVSECICFTLSTDVNCW